MPKILGYKITEQISAANQMLSSTLKKLNKKLRFDIIIAVIEKLEIS